MVEFPLVLTRARNRAVKGGERAVIYNRVVGIKKDTYGEGTHFMLPWFDRPIIFEVRTRPRQIQSLTGSKGMWRCCSVACGCPGLLTPPPCLCSCRHANGSSIVASFDATRPHTAASNLSDARIRYAAGMSRGNCT